MAESKIKYILDDEVITVTPTAASGYSIVNHNISKCGRIVSLFIAITTVVLLINLIHNINHSKFILNF